LKVLRFSFFTSLNFVLGKVGQVKYPLKYWDGSYISEDTDKYFNVVITSSF